ncbi:MAG: hypothetical protein QY326_04345 [Bdellovibrionota bacterium]|nr:MAG: hypothetical protein QY326_04345 [Bdellovibrionota bacterium]
MKKLFPVLALVLIAVLAWYFSTAPGTDGAASTSSPSQPAPKEVSGQSGNDRGPSSSPLGGAVTTLEEEDDEDLEDVDIRPATEIYTSAEDALKAVKAGANTYDDIVLEQFTMLDPKCSWCPAFYESVRELTFSPSSTPDQRSFYSELLAISGRVENVSALVDAIKNAPNQSERDIYSEALELTIGGDEVVKYLNESMATQDPQLKESLVAAMTNQGSRLAAELLYKQTMEAGDADGYYSLGIGLGEFVPEDEALPLLQQYALQRDQYSHLPMKALLNGGLPGLRIVFDILESSSDQEADKRLLRDAVDHVGYDEETEAYLKQMVQSAKNPVAVAFAKQVLEDFQGDLDEEVLDEGEEEPED